MATEKSIAPVIVPSKGKSHALTPVSDAPIAPPPAAESKVTPKAPPPAAPKTASQIIASPNVDMGALKALVATLEKEKADLLKKIAKLDKKLQPLATEEDLLVALGLVEETDWRVAWHGVTLPMFDVASTHWKRGAIKRNEDGRIVQAFFAVPRDEDPLGPQHRARSMIAVYIGKDAEGRFPSAPYIYLTESEVQDLRADG